MADPELKQQVQDLISENDLLVFIKGSPEQPRCGFSMRMIQVLETYGVPYGAVDALQALEPLREVTGELNDWKTFPQLYVRGELVGGADIVEEMHESGELADLLGVEQPAPVNGADETSATSDAPYQSPPMDIEGSSENGAADK